MTTKHPILAKLEQRKLNRPGIIKEFPINFGDKVSIKQAVYIQPLLAVEMDTAKTKAELYCKSMRIESESAILDAQSIECLVFAYRDPETKEKIFENGNDLRTNLTPDEIGQLIHLLNVSTWSISNQKIVDSKETAIEFAKQLAREGDTEAIELLQINDLMQLCLHLAKELEKKAS